MSFDLLDKINNLPEGIKISKKFNKNEINIASINTQDEKAYVSLADNDNTFVESKTDLTKFEPIIAYKGDRNLIYITGPSGAGKSIIAAEFAKQYKILNKDNKVFYCCSTDMKDDRTWGPLDFVTPINICSIYSLDMPEEDEKEMIKKLFSNSMIVFDDLDMMPPSMKKVMTRFQGKIVEVGRKYEISCIIISHIICGGVNTKMILNECNLYITFKSMLKNNRFLKHYKGFTDEQLATIKTPSWAAFNYRYGYIITPKTIKKI